MHHSRTYQFRRESDHFDFVAWLRAYESENKCDTRARFGFIRDPLTPVYSRVTLAPDAGHAEVIFNAPEAFNAVAI